MSITIISGCQLITTWSCGHRKQLLQCCERRDWLLARFISQICVVYQRQSIHSQSVVPWYKKMFSYHCCHQVSTVALCWRRLALEAFSRRLLYFFAMKIEEVSMEHTNQIKYTRSEAKVNDTHGWVVRVPACRRDLAMSGLACSESQRNSHYKSPEYFHFICLRYIFVRSVKIRWLLCIRRYGA